MVWYDVIFVILTMLLCHLSLHKSLPRFLAWIGWKTRGFWWSSQWTRSLGCHGNGGDRISRLAVAKTNHGRRFWWQIALEKRKSEITVVAFWTSLTSSHRLPIYPVAHDMRPCVVLFIHKNFFLLTFHSFLGYVLYGRRTRIYSRMTSATRRS